MCGRGRSGQREARARSRLLQPAAVLLAVAILGALALVLGNDLLRREEQARLAARAALVERLSGWESTSASPALLAAAAHSLPFRPGDPANADLLLRLQISASGDVNHLLVLLDRDGRVSAAYPAGARVEAATLGRAWSAALAGRSGLSPVIVEGALPRRATLVPIGGPLPWAVLVAVSTDQVHLIIGDGMAALLGAGAGTVSTVDPTGVALTSTDPAAVGTHIVDAAELATSTTTRGTGTGSSVAPASGTHIWRTCGPDGEVVNIAARQTGTGYFTYFRQPAGSLYSDLRSRGHRRNLTLLCVALTATLSILFIALRRALSARQTENWLRSLFAAASDIVLVTDRTTAMVFVSPAIETMLGYRAADWSGRPVTDLAHRDDAHRLRRLVEDPDQAHGSELGLRLRTASGGIAWFDVAARPLPAHGSPTEMIITCHAAGQRKRLLDQLTHQARHDALTGLLNRSAFTERLAAAVGAATAEDSTATAGSTGRPLAVLFVDLDRFKPVNDTFGHLAGDRVLREIGTRLRAELGPRAAGARFGGDEFGILLPDTDARAAGEAATRIICSFGRPVFIDDDTAVRVAASVGIALTDVATPTESLLQFADQAMYQAKQLGPGRFALRVGSALDTHPSTGWRSRHTVGGFTVIEPADDSRRDAIALETHRSSPHRSPERAGTGSPQVPSQPGAGPQDSRPPGAGPQHPATRARSDRGAPRRGRRHRSRTRWSSTRRGRTRGTRRARRAYGVLPSVISLLVLAMMILASATTIVAVEHTNQRRLDDRQIRQATQLANTTAKIISQLNQPSYLIAPISALPWSLTDRAADARTLDSIAGPDLSTPDVVLALVDLGGQPLAVRPSGAKVPIDPGSRVWELARDGGLNVVVAGPTTPRQGLHPPVDDVLAVSVVPVRRDGRDVAFLLLTRALTRASVAELARALGILPDSGQTSGTTNASSPTGRSRPAITITLVDADGHAVISTDRALLGRTLVDPAQLRSVRPGNSRQVVLRTAGGAQLADVGVIPAVPRPYYLVLRQDGRMVEGPSPGRPASDLVVYALVIVTAAALLWTLLRESQRTRREGARLTMLLHESHDIVVVLNRAGRATFITSAVEGLLGHRAVHLLGRPLLDLVHPGDRAAVQAYLDAHPCGGASPGPDSLLDIRLYTATGDHRWFDLAAARRAGPLGRDLMVTCHEVGERRRLQARIWWQASHDTLTGLGSRIGLADRLDRLADARTPFTILLIDLDDFKPVNDTFGHHVGDEVLRVIATRLVAIAGVAPDDVFRLGGDEFLIVLPEADESAVRTILTDARRTIATPVDVAGRTFTIRAAVGVASSRGLTGPDPGRPDPDAVIRRADAAMYAAKRTSRGPRQMHPTPR
ncbi:diguanylate cyclase domain-containing protein [Frankia sp. R82]|uniref:diguanylate cyclase domain-containing protein n=1 Tax=Frankia sp. R82 TaxID=2950553 RepID=UPI002043AB30|nr:diguanylate cyclase [Frankia sp. R82]MCM3884037.1 diguanylate cyclase [Frankia sp. R82]